MTRSLSLPSLRGLGARVSGVLHRFARARGGVAATEFALLAPSMLAVWVGMVVATDAIHADRRVTLVARTLADITTQMTVVNQTDMDAVFQAAESVMFPQPATRIGMRITSITIDAKGKAYVDWSVVPSNLAQRGGFTALSHCAGFGTLPNALKIPRTSIVYAEVAMAYEPSVASQIVKELFQGSVKGDDTMPLGDSLYMRPRQASKVAFTPSPSACPGFVP